MHTPMCECSGLLGSIAPLSDNSDSVEMMSICQQDLKSAFPFPMMFDIAQEQQFGSPPSLYAEMALTNPWKQIFPANDPIVNIFEDLNYALRLADYKSSQGQSWKVVNFVVYRLCPIVHKLISLKTNRFLADYWDVVREASRLAIFFFLSEPRRQCGALGVSNTLFLSKFKCHMSTFGTSIDWKLCRPLHLWMLFFGTLESRGFLEQDWFAETLISVARTMQLDSWGAIVDAVQGFLWVEDVYDTKAAIVGQNLMGEVS